VVEKSGSFGTSILAKTGVSKTPVFLSRDQRRLDLGVIAPSHKLAKLRDLGAKLIEFRFPVDRAPRRCQRRGMMSESLGLTSHKSSCNCTGCGMLRVGVCINCAVAAAPATARNRPRRPDLALATSAVARLVHAHAALLLLVPEAA
jgi:hypothetical protein